MPRNKNKCRSLSIPGAGGWQPKPTDDASTTIVQQPVCGGEQLSISIGEAQLRAGVLKNACRCHSSNLPSIKAASPSPIVSQSVGLPEPRTGQSILSVCRCVCGKNANHQSLNLYREWQATSNGSSGSSLGRYSRSRGVQTLFHDFLSHLGTSSPLEFCLCTYSEPCS